MPEYREIYDHHADRYDALVAREDHQRNLPRLLAEIVAGNALDIVETGAGTGRLSRILAPKARNLRAFDASSAMIAVARQQLSDLPQVECAVATHDALPVAETSADLAAEGWAFGHAVGWNPSAWRDEIRRWVIELERIVRPGGHLVLVETMGTGVESPFAGGHSLEAFHSFVVDMLGFSHRSVRTDYAFDSVAEAAEAIGFFFGDPMAAEVRRRGWQIVPECTGVYWRTRSSSPHG